MKTKLIALFALFVFFCSARAGTVGQTGPLISPASNGATVSYQGSSSTSPLQSLLQGRTVTLNGAAPGGATLLDQLLAKPLNIPGNITVNASTPLTAGQLAAGAITLASRVNPVIKAATVAAMILQDLRAKSDGAGGLIQDVGVTPDMVSTGCWKARGSCFGSPQQAYESMYPPGVDPYNPSMQYGGSVCVINADATQASCKVTYLDPNNPNYMAYAYPGTVDHVTAQMPSCPGYIDPLNPALNRPAGDAPGPDGMCATGRYSPTPADKLKTAFQKMLENGLESPPLVAEKIINEGGTIETSPTVLSGPASSIGQSTTTTTTSASGTETSVSTPTYNYTYNGNQVSYTTNNSTSISTTNTTTGETTTKTSTTTGLPVDSSDLCAKHPEALACQNLGDVPTDVVPKVDKSVSLSYEELSLPSACPSDIPLPHGNVLSFASACDTAQKIRPLIIAVGVFSALLIALAAVRGVS